jgi:hypothetical protein
MMLLCDCDDHELALFDPLFGLLVPDRHGPATTASP